MNLVPHSHIELYLSRLSKPIAQKLRLVNHIPTDAKNVLDVGCADGALTLEMAKILPDINFKGIDLQDVFIEKAIDNAKGATNLSFENVYLRQLLERDERYDAIVFCSVLHEFASYGEGKSSIIKAISDAHELCRRGGRILIRDMILSSYKRKTDYKIEKIIEKIYKKEEVAPFLKSFEDKYGKINNMYDLNHFLLKYKYQENWERELNENYLPVTFEEYEQICDLLGMKILYKDSFCLEYFKEIWKSDFDLSDFEIEGLKSTGFIIAEKI